VVEDRSSESPCPPEDDLLAFSSGEVSEAQRATLIGHLAGCDECRIVTSELSKQRLGHAATATPDPAPRAEPAHDAGHYERKRRLSFAPGETIAGKFKVVKVLGAGGMGVVLEAEHLLLEQRVALKFMGTELAADPEATRRFLREARAAARIPSEHVVKILDVATLDDGTPFIVMERLHGADLSTLLEREGRLDPARAVGYVLEAMEALAHAHTKGIVHRDLKPANLFLAEREDGTTTVKVLDFGIAKAQERADASGVTTSRTVLGSPRYMAPEQMQSAKDVDMRADVWALGTILFELVAGRPAFEGETLAALSVAICAGEKPSLAAALPGVSLELDAAVSGCLERSLAARTPDVAALAMALAPLGPASSYASVERIVSVLPSSGGLLLDAPARAGSVPPPSRESARRPSRKVASASVVAVAVVVGALGLFGGIFVGLGTLRAPPKVAAVVPPPPPAAPSSSPAPSADAPPPAAPSAPQPGASPRGAPPQVAPKKPAPAAPSQSARVAPPLPAGTGTPYDDRK